MSDPSTHPVRPPHVTVASAIVIVGSLFVVLEMWDRIAGLHSLDTRTTFAAYLADSRLGRAGVDVGQLTTIVRIAAMAAAGCATAMAILGWFVRRRSRSARLALSVLAGALVVTGMVSDWFVESIGATFWAAGIGGAVVTLWLGPAGLWFSGKQASGTPASRRDDPWARPSAPPPPRTYDAPAPPPQPPPPQPPTPQAPTPQAPTPQPPSPTEQPWPPTAWTPPPTTAYDVDRLQPERGSRPSALLAACILTWTCTAFAAVILAISIASLASDATPILDEAYRQNPQLTDQGFTRHELLVGLYVVIAFVLLSAAAAAAFAVVLYRGHRWAWYGLLVAAAVSTLFFLVGTLGSLVGLLPAAASGVTFFLLLRPEVRGWLVSRT